MFSSLHSFSIIKIVSLRFFLANVWFLQGWASRLQGLAAGVAAGSLLFTALTELLPEASSLGNQRAGTLVIMSAVLMMIIDACLH